MQLHPIKNIRVYCGPGALIAITGKELAEVRAAINIGIGRRENIGIMRMHNHQLEKALELLKVDFKKHLVEDRLTLSHFSRSVAEKDKRYIVQITGHYVTLLNGTLIDNQYRFGTDVVDCRHSKKLVRNYYLVED